MAKKQAAQVFVDPTDAGTSLASDHQNPLERWIYELHSSLFLSDRGTLIVGVAGIGTLGLLIIGLVLWWPGWQRLKRSLSISTRAKGRALLSVFHRTIGIYVAPMLLVIAINGTMLVFRQELIYPMETEVKVVHSHEDAL